MTETSIKGPKAFVEFVEEVAELADVMREDRARVGGLHDVDGEERAA